LITEGWYEGTEQPELAQPLTCALSRKWWGRDSISIVMRWPFMAFGDLRVGGLENHDTPIDFILWLGSRNRFEALFLFPFLSFRYQYAACITMLAFFLQVPSVRGHMMLRRSEPRQNQRTYSSKTSYHWSLRSNKSTVPLEILYELWQFIQLVLIDFIHHTVQHNAKSNHDEAGGGEAGKCLLPVSASKVLEDGYSNNSGPVSRFVRPRLQNQVRAIW
jgi:hypothetical protein